MTDAALRALLEEEIEAHSGNSAGTNYCWWCIRNINGIDGDKEPHRDDCWLVRVRAALQASVPVDVVTHRDGCASWTTCDCGAQRFEIPVAVSGATQEPENEIRWVACGHCHGDGGFGGTCAVCRGSGKIYIGAIPARSPSAPSVSPPPDAETALEHSTCEDCGTGFKHESWSEVGVCGPCFMIRRRDAHIEELEAQLRAALSASASAQKEP